MSVPYERFNREVKYFNGGEWFWGWSAPFDDDSEQGKPDTQQAAKAWKACMSPSESKQSPPKHTEK